MPRSAGSCAEGSSGSRRTKLTSASSGSATARPTRGAAAALARALASRRGVGRCGMLGARVGWAPAAHAAAAAPRPSRCACRAERGDGLAQMPPRLIEGVLGQRHLEPGIARLAGGAGLRLLALRRRLLQRAPVLVVGELGLEPGARRLERGQLVGCSPEAATQSSCHRSSGRPRLPEMPVQAGFLAPRPSDRVHAVVCATLAAADSGDHRRPRYTRLPAVALREGGTGRGGSGPWSGRCCFAS